MVSAGIQSFVCLDEKYRCAIQDLISLALYPLAKTCCSCSFYDNCGVPDMKKVVQLLGRKQEVSCAL